MKVMILPSSMKLLLSYISEKQHIFKSLKQVLGGFFYNTQLRILLGVGIRWDGWGEAAKSRGWVGEDYWAYLCWPCRTGGQWKHSIPSMILGATKFGKPGGVGFVDLLESVDFFGIFSAHIFCFVLFLWRWCKYIPHQHPFQAILSKNWSKLFDIFDGRTNLVLPDFLLWFFLFKMISSGDLDFCLLFVSFAGGTWVELDPVFHKAGWLLAA